MSLFIFEQQLRSTHTFVAGLDEAGRGAWAGPVVSAAVVFSESHIPIAEINDSKKLTPAKRQALYYQICRSALAYAVGISDQQIIDQINILQATKLSMKQAVHSLSVVPQLLLIDGKNMEIDFPTQQHSIIDGDALCYSIAAASILAKVTRDQVMCEAAKKYPGYGFEQHKGYGTQQHQIALSRFGCTPLHRKSYKPVQKFLGMS